MATGERSTCDRRLRSESPPASCRSPPSSSKPIRWIGHCSRRFWLLAVLDKKGHAIYHSDHSAQGSRTLPRAGVEGLFKALNGRPFMYVFGQWYRLQVVPLRANVLCHLFLRPGGFLRPGSIPLCFNNLSVRPLPDHDGRLICFFYRSFLAQGAVLLARPRRTRSTTASPWLSSC